MGWRALIGHALFYGCVAGIHLHALACGCDFLEIHLLAVVDFGSFFLAVLWTTVSCAWLQLFRLGWACTILLLLL
jgi:hypothetical protein